MANAYGPRSTLRIQPTHIQIAAGIDREMFERCELAGGGIYCKAFGDCTEIQRQGTP